MTVSEIIDRMEELKAQINALAVKQAMVMQDIMAKPGPKLKEDGHHNRRSIAVTDDLWLWCEQRALELGFISTSAFIASVLMKEKEFRKKS